MFVSTSRLQFSRPTTDEERRHILETYEGLTTVPGFRAFYLARPSETESAAVFIFDSEPDFRKAYEQVGPEIHAIIDPLIVGAPQGESGEVNSEYTNWSMSAGFLSLRRAQVKDPHSVAERKPIGKAYADAVAQLPEGRHVFIEFWPSDSQLVHFGVYDSRDSRTRFMQQLRTVFKPVAGQEGQIVPPVQETAGDVWAYRVK